MPRPRKDPLFELAGQWIAKEPGRDDLYRYWYDSGLKRVRRASLGLKDLEAAKLKLAEEVIQAAKPTQSSPLALVMLRYHEQHSDQLRSAKMARTATRKFLAYFGQTVTLAELTEDRQADFARKMAADKSANSYIKRIFGVIAAGVAYARLTHEVKIFGGLDWLERLTPFGRSPRKAVIPSDQDIKTLLSWPSPEPLFRWMLLSLATGARPEAVMTFTTDQRQHGLLDLNPEWRRQNKKYRPIVQEPSILTPYLDEWGKDAGRRGDHRYIPYSSVSAVQTGIARLSEATGIKVNAYSFRHKVATVLRRAKSEGVSEDDVAMQLGHRRPHLRIAGAYGEFEPDYLDEPRKALDRWLRGLRFSRHTPSDARDAAKNAGEMLKRTIA
jgi:integrase